MGLSTVCNETAPGSFVYTFESLSFMQNIPAPVGGRDVLARCKGFDPLTFWSVARRSIQLS